MPQMKQNDKIIIIKETDAGLRRFSIPKDYDDEDLGVAVQAVWDAKIQMTTRLLEAIKQGLSTSEISTSQISLLESDKLIEELRAKLNQKNKCKQSSIMKCNFHIIQ